MSNETSFRHAESGEKFAKAVRRGRPKKWAFEEMVVGGIAVVESPDDHASARSAANRAEGEYATRKLADGSLLIKRVS